MLGPKQAKEPAFIIGCGAVLVTISPMMLLHASVHLRTSVEHTPEWPSGSHCSICVGKAYLGVFNGGTPPSHAGTV